MSYHPYGEENETAQLLHHTNMKSIDMSDIITLSSLVESLGAVN